MIAVQTDFKARSEEVTRYFRFLYEFAENRISFLPPPSGTDSFTNLDQDSLFKTLKANGFLLLYNLIESTLKNAIEAIFDEFKGRAVTFDSCRSEVRKIVLKNLKKHDVDTLLPSITSISIDVLAATFRKEKLFSGNIDGRRIRGVAGEYGFQVPKKKSDELLTVKTHRNDLAHGVKSFADVGRDFDVVRLEAIRNEVTVFLEELLVNVADYINKQAYLSGP